MGWIFLEAVVALALAVGIVWWTMGPKRKRTPGAPDKGDKGSDGAVGTTGAQARGGVDGRADDRAPR